MKKLAVVMMTLFAFSAVAFAEEAAAPAAGNTTEQQAPEKTNENPQKTEKVKKGKKNKKKKMEKSEKAD